MLVGFVAPAEFWPQYLRIQINQYSYVRSKSYDSVLYKLEKVKLTNEVGVKRLGIRTFVWVSMVYPTASLTNPKPRRASAIETDSREVKEAKEQHKAMIG